MEEEYVRYVISAHGSDDKSSTDILTGGKILFYVNDGEMYSSSNKYQTWVCEGRGIPVETILEGKTYPASMYFSGDNFRMWRSGLKDCKKGSIILDIDRNHIRIHLKTLLEDVLKPYHELNHPGKKFELHVLTCRVCTTDTNKPIGKKITRRHEPRDRSRYIKPKKEKPQPNEAAVAVPDGEERKFYEKYLKYKAKYLNLKKLIGN